MHKENNDHEKVGHAEDVETLCEDMISKDKSLLVFCSLDRKVCGLFTKDTQSIDEDFDLNSLDMKQIVTESRNNFLHAEKDGSVCDTGYFYFTNHLGAIRLIPRLLFNLY